MTHNIFHKRLAAAAVFFALIIFVWSLSSTGAKVYSDNQSTVEPVPVPTPSRSTTSIAPAMPPTIVRASSSIAEPVRAPAPPQVEATPTAPMATDDLSGDALAETSGTLGAILFGAFATGLFALFFARRSHNKPGMPGALAAAR